MRSTRANAIPLRALARCRDQLRVICKAKVIIAAKPEVFPSVYEYAGLLGALQGQALPEQILFLAAAQLLA